MHCVKTCLLLASAIPFFVTSRAISLLFRHVLCKVYRGGSYFFFGSPYDNVRAFFIVVASFLLSRRRFYRFGVVFIVTLRILFANPYFFILF